jgi:serine/threonine protein kinase
VKELQTLYRADNPHLISFYGAFFKDGSISILIELMDAGSISDVLKAVKAFTEPQIAWVAKQVIIFENDTMIGGLC